MNHRFISIIKRSGSPISPEIINTNNLIPDMEWRLGHELVQPGGCKELHFPLPNISQTTEKHRNALTAYFLGGKLFLVAIVQAVQGLESCPPPLPLLFHTQLHFMSCNVFTFLRKAHKKREHLPKPWFKIPHAWLEKPFSSWLAQSPWYCSQDREICRGSATRHLFNFGFAFWIESLGLTSHRGFPNGILIASQFSFWQTQTYLSLNLMSTTCFIRGRKIVTKIKIKNSAMGNTFKCKEFVWQGKKGVSWGLVSSAIPHY